MSQFIVDTLTLQMSGGGGSVAFPSFPIGSLLAILTLDVEHQTYLRRLAQTLHFTPHIIDLHSMDRSSTRMWNVSELTRIELLLMRYAVRVVIGATGLSSMSTLLASFPLRTTAFDRNVAIAEYAGTILTANAIERAVVLDPRVVVVPAISTPDRPPHFAAHPPPRRGGKKFKAYVRGWTLKSNGEVVRRERVLRRNRVLAKLAGIVDGGQGARVVMLEAPGAGNTTDILTTDPVSKDKLRRIDMINQSEAVARKLFQDHCRGGGANGDAVWKIKSYYASWNEYWISRHSQKRAANVIFYDGCNNAGLKILDAMRCVLRNQTIRANSDIVLGYTMVAHRYKHDGTTLRTRECKLFGEFRTLAAKYRWTLDPESVEVLRERTVITRFVRLSPNHATCSIGSTCGHDVVSRLYGVICTGVEYGPGTCPSGAEACDACVKTIHASPNEWVCEGCQFDKI